MAVQLFKTLLNQIPLLSSLQSGTLPLFGYSAWGRPMKKAHTGESGLKWEAKDSSKLIGNKDHALRGLSSPMAVIRQIRLIT
ncbi:protein YahM [Escherichia coli]|uniref:protein YahM n=1 Tax=Escherichia coli TaxID=562 RepID=UPI000F881D73|nr:protein YahM [Escherichia coli]